MTDAEFVQWLAAGRVLVIGPVESPSPLTQQVEQAFAEGGGAEAAWGKLREAYSACQAPRWQDCAYCPWERCWYSDLVDDEV